ncbi:MAG TPA: flagellar biosynthetic protein FliO [Spirochaetota bacterium]|nr:flagellar biosynthetic protein FliO [Spirochaetota bacterium]
MAIFFIVSLVINSFFLYSQDVTGDKKVLSEKEYFEKVKNSMGEKKGNDTKDANKKSEKKINLTKGYLDYIRIIVVLALVVGAIYGIFYFIKKSLKIKDEVGEGSTILLNHSIGPGKWLQIVYIGGKYLILGITNDSINLISEITDQKEIERLEIGLNDRKTEEGNTFSNIISGFFKNNLKFKEEKKQFDYEEDGIDFIKKQKDRLDKL